MSEHDRGLAELFERWPASRPMEVTLVDERTKREVTHLLPEAVDLGGVKLQARADFGYTVLDSDCEEGHGLRVLFPEDGEGEAKAVADEAGLEPAVTGGGEPAPKLRGRAAKRVRRAGELAFISGGGGVQQGAPPRRWGARAWGGGARVLARGVGGTRECDAMHAKRTGPFSRTASSR